MKKTYIFYLMLILSLSFSACDSFLEEKSQDLVVPKTVSEYKELILGEAYNSNEDATPYLEVMTDNVTEYVNPGSYYKGDHRSSTFGYYAWQKDAEVSLTGTRVYDKAWEILYHKILFANIIIEKANEGLEGSEEELNDLLGEAYFLKAYSYFMLANLYGDPYNETTAANDLCVPINNDTSVEDKTYKRETVAKVYEEINFNMNECIKYFEKTNVTKTYFRINKYSAYLLASRIALYQNKYKDVVDYTTKVIMEKGTLYNLNSFDESYFINTSNPEILFSCGTVSSSTYTRYAQGSYCTSSELMNLYVETEESTDLRRGVFFQKRSGLYRYNKCNTYKRIYDICFRASEAYLNRAEALCHIDGKYGEAIQDINTLRQNRISGKYNVEASNKEEALELVKKERRMELCFENHRWFDLRRWGRPEISHSYTSIDAIDDVKTYTLSKNDPAYTLQIPKMILEMNNSIIKNERPERTAK